MGPAVAQSHQSCDNGTVAFFPIVPLLSLQWVRVGRQQPGAESLRAACRTCRGGETRVQAVGTRAQAEQGGAGGSLRADGHSLIKRWRWPCQLSPRPWTNGCLTCLWGYKAERVSGPWDGGIPPCVPLQPSLLSPNLDADFFLALLKGVTAQHLHFGHDLEEGLSGWGGGPWDSIEAPGHGAAPTFTAQTFSRPQSNTFRMVPKEPLATKPRIWEEGRGQELYTLWNDEEYTPPGWVSGIGQGGWK